MATVSTANITYSYKSQVSPPLGRFLRSCTHQSRNVLFLCNPNVRHPVHKTLPPCYREVQFRFVTGLFKHICSPQN